MRAVKLYFLRRYAAKISYELELHGAEPDLERMPARYAELLGGGDRDRLERGACGSTTSIAASTSPPTCAPGRSSRTGAGTCASASGSGGSPSRRRESGWPGCGAAVSGSAPIELLAESLGEELRFEALAADFA